MTKKNSKNEGIIDNMNEQAMSLSEAAHVAYGLYEKVYLKTSKITISLSTKFSTNLGELPKNGGKCVEERVENS